MLAIAISIQVKWVHIFNTEYHYYFYLPEQKVFKESAMGYTTLEYSQVSIADIRIAKISEIQADSSEYR